MPIRGRNTCILGLCAFTLIVGSPRDSRAQSSNPFGPLFGQSSGQSSTQPAPHHSTQTVAHHSTGGLHTYTDPANGGHLAYIKTAAGGGARSGMRKFLGNIDATSQHTMKVIAATTDPQDKVVHALLTLQLGGQPNLAVAVTVAAPEGTVSGILYGSPAVLKASYGNLSSYFSRQIPAGSQPSREEESIGPIPSTASWRRQTGGDRSTSVLLPSNGEWHVTGAAKGAADVVGPRGAAMELGLAYPILTRPILPGGGGMIAPYMPPAQAMLWYTSRVLHSTGATLLDHQPAPSLTGGGQTEFVTLSVPLPNGNVFKTIALVSCTPVTPQEWLLYMSFISAPQAEFNSLVPTMIAIWENWKIDPGFQAERIRQIARTVTETRRGYADTIANTERVYDEANEAWDEYIRGVTTVPDGAGGRRQVPVDSPEGILADCRRRQRVCEELPVQQVAP